MNTKFETRMARIEVLTEHLEHSPNLEARAVARELVGTLLDLHADGLARILETLSEGGNREIVATLAQDGQVGSLLLLHGLHPHDLATRVQRALDHARSQVLAKTDTTLDLVSLVGETATLRLGRASGCGGGCPSSAANVRRGVQELLLSAVPDLEAIEFEEAVIPQHGSIYLPVITL